MLLAALLLATNLNFPIVELGDCSSLSSCKNYCEITWHQTVCTEYGVRLGVIRGKVLAAVNVSYPIAELGNCDSKDECRAYCDVPANRPACVDFARAHGIEASVEASGGQAPAERPGGGLAGVSFPIVELGNCASKEACKAYCDQFVNRQACFDFAYQHGLQKGKKAAEAFAGLTFPISELGNCDSLAECEVYCEQPDHRQTCKDYAKAHGFEPPKKMDGPGGCSGPEECDAYCSNPDHRIECEAAWQEHCAPHPDWPECQKGPGGKGGPGGCASDAECRAYCEAHPDDEDCQRGREEYCQKHPDECREQRGPGGCISEEECRLYCEQNPTDADCQRGREEWCREHPDECREGGEAGPCQGDEECRRYCQQNPNDEYCQRKRGPSDGGPDGGPSECGGMGCAEFCRQNPDDEY